MNHSPTSTPPSTDAFAALGEFGPHVNIAEELFARAAEAPERTAIRAPRKKRGWRDTSYAELAERTRAAAAGLAAAGVRPGDRACVFVRPGPELIQCTYALMALGAVPVLIDPGMGRKALLSCVQRMAPRVFLGVPEAQLARLLYRRAFKSVELCVHVGARVSLGGPSLAGLERSARDESFECVQSARDDTAAILFTSGSTGPPKGVVYTHGMFEAQRRALRTLFGFRAGEVDVACFPLFALFDTALGMTSVFPRLDPSRPGQCDPAQIVAAIEESSATLSFGSPAIWRRVAPWCRERDRVLESLSRVLIAGAPVPNACSSTRVRPRRPSSVRCITWGCW